MAIKRAENGAEHAEEEAELTMISSNKVWPTQ